MHSSLKHFPIGPIWLRLRRALNFGLSVELNTFLAKWHYLGIVRSFPPLNSGAGTVDCFMLLNDARIWEGLWSLYSFRTYFGPCRIIVLNDGTLKPASIELLRTVFPGILIPDFETNDNEMDAYLAQRRLRRCREWRKRFVFFRKLVDSIKLAQAGGLILLDSDCLHFRVPLEVTKWAEKPVQADAPQGGELRGDRRRRRLGRSARVRGAEDEARPDGAAPARASATPPGSAHLPGSTSRRLRRRRPDGGGRTPRSRASPRDGGGHRGSGNTSD